MEQGNCLPPLKLVLNLELTSVIVNVLLLLTSSNFYQLHQIS